LCEISFAWAEYLMPRKRLRNPSTMRLVQMLVAEIESTPNLQLNLFINAVGVRGVRITRSIADEILLVNAVILAEEFSRAAL